MCVAVGIIGGGIASGAIGAAGAKSAAGTQAGAAENAQQISQNEFNTITGQEQPYMQAGYGAQSQLNYLLGIGQPGTEASGATAGTPGSYNARTGLTMGGTPGRPGTPGTASSSLAGGYGSLTQPFNASYMQQYSPAYKFQLQQGQQGVLNQDAAAYGGESGAALKDLTSFNQNYANTAFNSAFNQYQTQQGNTYSRLAGISQLGQAAATNTGQQGTALAGQAAQSATNIGTAQAAGTVGAANALGGGIGNAAILGSLYGNQASGFNPGSLNIGYTGETGVDTESGLNYLTGY